MKKLYPLFACIGVVMIGIGGQLKSEPTVASGALIFGFFAPAFLKWALANPARPTRPR